MLAKLQQKQLGQVSTMACWVADKGRMREPETTTVARMAAPTPIIPVITLDTFVPLCLLALLRLSGCGSDGC